MEIFQKNVHWDERAKNVEKVTDIREHALVNIQFKSGERIAEHDAAEHVVVIVRRGRVAFTVEGNEVTVTNEAVLVMEPNERHSLVALDDTDLLLVKIK